MTRLCRKCRGMPSSATLSPTLTLFSAAQHLSPSFGLMGVCVWLCVYSYSRIRKGVTPLHLPPSCTSPYPQLHALQSDIHSINPAQNNDAKAVQLHSWPSSAAHHFSVCVRSARHFNCKIFCKLIRQRGGRLVWVCVCSLCSNKLMATRGYRQGQACIEEG